MGRSLLTVWPWRPEDAELVTSPGTGSINLQSKPGRACVVPR